MRQTGRDCKHCSKFGASGLHICCSNSARPRNASLRLYNAAGSTVVPRRRRRRDRDSRDGDSRDRDRSHYYGEDTWVVVVGASRYFANYRHARNAL